MRRRSTSGGSGAARARSSPDWSSGAARGVSQRLEPGRDGPSGFDGGRVHARVPIDRCGAEARLGERARAADGAVRGTGTPTYIRSDNADEFTAKAGREWLRRLGVQTLFIEPGSPWENGYNGSFNGKLRDELLNGEIFYTLTEAKVLIERWRQEYSTFRPHSSLGYLPPAPEATQWPAPAGAKQSFRASSMIRATRRCSSARLWLATKNEAWRRWWMVAAGPLHPRRGHARRGTPASTVLTVAAVSTRSASDLRP